MKPLFGGRPASLRHGGGSTDSDEDAALLQHRYAGAPTANVSDLELLGPEGPKDAWVCGAAAIQWLVPCIFMRAQEGSTSYGREGLHARSSSDDLRRGNGVS